MRCSAIHRNPPISPSRSTSHWIRRIFSVDQHRELKRLCESLGILYLCTPFSRVGADILEELGVAAYKTGSGQLTNLPLIEHIAGSGNP